jgi:hypothetical protein
MLNPPAASSTRMLADVGNREISQSRSPSRHTELLPKSMMELTISVAQAQYYIERNAELYAAGWLTNRR